MTDPARPAPDLRPTALAVLAAVAFAAATLLLDGRGITFLWDDWDFLAAIRAHGARSIVEPYGVHWQPVFRLALWAEVLAFGGREHFPYLVVNLLVHAVNLVLLARVLAARCSDERAAALATAAFGLATSYRILLLWLTGLSVLLAFTLTAGGFLAFERWRQSQERRDLALVLACVGAAPLCNAMGVALGPALACEAWVLRVPRRGRFAGLVAAAWGATAVASAVAVAGASHGPSLGALVRLDPDRLSRMAAFLLEAIGLGFVRQVPLLPVSGGPVAGMLLAFAYVLGLALALALLGAEARRRVLAAHAFLVFLVSPMAAVRASYVWSDRPNAASQHYQYFPGLAWGTLAAAVAAPLLRRRPRAGLVGSLALLGLLAQRHAAASREDRTYSAPVVRRALHEAEIVERLSAIAAASTGSLYDAPLPHWLAWKERRASDLVLVHDPDLRPSWTPEASPASVGPLAADPLLAATLGLAGR